MKKYELRINFSEKLKDEISNNNILFSLLKPKYDYYVFSIDDEETQEKHGVFEEIYSVYRKAEYLFNINVIKDCDISFWLLFEYENQRNIEFSFDEVLILSKMRCTVCISCWEK